MIKTNKTSPLHRYCNLVHSSLLSSAKILQSLARGPSCVCGFTWLADEGNTHSKRFNANGFTTVGPGHFSLEKDARGRFKDISISIAT